MGSEGEQQTIYFIICTWSTVILYFLTSNCGPGTGKKEQLTCFSFALTVNLLNNGDDSVSKLITIVIWEWISEKFFSSFVIKMVRYKLENWDKNPHLYRMFHESKLLYSIRIVS